mgnify:CR=1 FL=1
MDENARYKYYKENHPDWSEEQIWTAISIDMKVKDTVQNKGEDVDINDESIIKAILEGAREWLNVVLPEIYVKVKNFFDEILKNIGRWIQKGLNYIIDKIDEFTK